MSELARTNEFWFLHHTLHVLVVDDDSDVRTILVDQLKLCPLLVAHAAGTAESALSALKAPDPLLCFCLLDLGLPAPMDGYHVLTAYANHIPIAVLTGRTLLMERERCMELGAVIVLQKPIVDICDFVHLVCTYAMKGRLLYMAGCNTYCRRSVRTLLSANPKGVAEWVARLRTDERYLRRKWEDQGHEPKHVLSIYWGYRYAIQDMVEGVSSSEEVLEHRKRILEYLAIRPTILGGPLTSGSRE